MLLIVKGLSRKVHRTWKVPFRSTKDKFKHKVNFYVKDRKTYDSWVRIKFSNKQNETVLWRQVLRMDISVSKSNVVLLLSVMLREGHYALCFPLCRVGMADLNKLYKVLCDIVTHLLEYLLKFFIFKQVAHHRKVQNLVPNCYSNPMSLLYYKEWYNIDLNWVYSQNQKSLNIPCL
jgi:hypothetical protein